MIAPEQPRRRFRAAGVDGGLDRRPSAGLRMPRVGSLRVTGEVHGGSRLALLYNTWRAPGSRVPPGGLEMADLKGSLVFWHSPNTRSTGARILLEELGAPHEMRVLNVKTGEQRKAAYLAVNPLGKVPAIVHDGALVTEQGAIFLYLATSFRWRRTRRRPRPRAEPGPHSSMSSATSSISPWSPAMGGLASRASAPAGAPLSTSRTETMRTTNKTESTNFPGIQPSTKKTAAKPAAAAEVPRGELPTLAFADPRAFSTWLAANCHLRAACGCGSPKKAIRRPVGHFYAEAIGVALAWGWIDGQKRPRRRGPRGLPAFCPRGARSTWSKINRDKATALIAAGRRCSRRGSPRSSAPSATAAGDGGLRRAEPRRRAKRGSGRRARRKPRAAAFFATLDAANRYSVLFRIQTPKKARDARQARRAFRRDARPAREDPRPTAARPPGLERLATSMALQLTTVLGS